MSHNTKRDREFACMAIVQAQLCAPDSKKKVCPKVGAVATTKDGKLLGSAYRGQIKKGEHAEYTLLERILKNQKHDLAGGTLYITLEPCTSRNCPKIPCAERIVKARIARVVYGMIDPNPKICGKGIRYLEEHGIIADRFPRNLIDQLEAMNAPFLQSVTQDKRASLSSEKAAPRPVSNERDSNKYYRDSNKYYKDKDTNEKKRLNIQSQLVKDFEQPVYDSIIYGKSNLNVLDIGCNNGRHIMARLGDKQEVQKIIGLEYDQKTVNLANKEFGAGKGKFYQCDLENDNLANFIESVMKKNKIQSFDIINLSMILLHLKNPYTIMRTLRKFLSFDGLLYIKDIDDGLNYAYPDSTKDFERIYQICENNETSGCRKSGRQIYSCLRKCGFKNIKLERSGLNSIGMNRDQKQALFDTYFSFIMEDLKIMRRRHPSDEKIKEDYKWYSAIYNSKNLEERFHEDGFIFSLGFMIFTASE